MALWLSSVGIRVGLATRVAHAHSTQQEDQTKIVRSAVRGERRALFEPMLSRCDAQSDGEIESYVTLIMVISLDLIDIGHWYHRLSRFANAG